jgi:pantoate--beta-alanine ligase
MKKIQRLTELRQDIAAFRSAGERIALVPTMGNLHQGHLQLVKEARRLADRVVATVFVNPTQFGPGEDYASYPRTPEADRAALAQAGADILFIPEVHEVYPRGLSALTSVEVPGLSEELCGAFRPGHFRGVATVVLKLFNMVNADIAVFGEKDYQQLTVIRQMVADLNLPLTIHGVPTVREADGLAMSSRNTYLSADERRKAAILYATLISSVAALKIGQSPISQIEAEASAALEAEGFRVDYVSVRRVLDLAAPGPEQDPGGLMVLVAARLGKTRLIDNLRVSVEV